LLRAIYVSVGEALALSLKDQGADSQHCIIDTQSLPFFVFNLPGMVEKPDRSTAFREEIGRTIMTREDRLWAAIQLSRLAPDHPLHQRITDGWKGGELEQPSAVLGPCYAGKPAAFVAVADVVRWTEDMRAPQRWQEMESERRKAADEAARQRGWEASERGRLERIEKELATLKK
jgi:hypothetical protein